MLRLETLRQRFSTTIADRDVVIFLSALLHQNSAFILSHPQASLNLFQYARFRWYVSQRKKGYSVAAIIGHKEFFGLDFIVSKHTLIPRPETELLVEETLKIIADPKNSKTLKNNDFLKNTSAAAIVVDVGTGSGCIPIAILKNTTAPIIVWAIDTSSRALQIAQKNTKKHQTPITFLRGNLLTPLPASIFSGNTPLVITANLPYLTHEQFANEPSIQREPYQALVAKKNVLALYEELFEQLQQRNVASPTKIIAPATNVAAPTTVVCEIDHMQPPELIKIIHNYFPNAKTTIKKDLAGRDRLVIAALNS